MMDDLPGMRIGQVHNVVAKHHRKDLTYKTSAYAYMVLNIITIRLPSNAFDLAHA